jgi:hypothetical protein
MRSSEDRKEYQRQYYLKNKEKSLATSKEWVNNHPEERKKIALRYSRNNRDKVNTTTKKVASRIRTQVLEAYGNKCTCCGETEPIFLTIDHINGVEPGSGARAGLPLYRYLVKNNFPPGFQILCYNCNCSKGYYGSCPHTGIIQVNNSRHTKVRLIVLETYGGRCGCCGESRNEFLAIHHTNGGGSQHRRTNTFPTQILKSIIKDGFPSDYSILCHNCNCSEGHYGICAHKG